jgi:hypothetical protein
MCRSRRARDEIMKTEGLVVLMYSMKKPPPVAQRGLKKTT